MEAGGMLSMIVQTVKKDVIMWPIILLGAISTTIIIERLVVVFLEKRKLNILKYLDGFLEGMENNQGDKEKTVAENIEYLESHPGIFSTVILAAFDKFKSGVSKGLSSIEMRKWMADTVESTAAVELPRLDSHLIALAVISNVATLMGLFGTVIGMIDSFTAMANSPGGVKADEMAGGIATALIATALGLFVAVPSLIAYNWIKATIEGYVVGVEETVYKIIDVLAE